MNLSDLKSEIEQLKAKRTELALKPISNFDIAKPLFRDGYASAQARKRGQIDDINRLIDKRLQLAGELALYGEDDNLGIGVN